MTKFLGEQYKNYTNRQIPLERVLSMANNGITAYLFRLHASPTESPSVNDSYQLPPGHVLLSPQFMPHREAKKPTDGYIICTVWHGKEKNEFWIFDANCLKQGPLCKLSAPLSSPPLKFAMTIHTAWLPKIGERQATYCIDVREDYEDLVRKASRYHPEIQDLFDQEVYPKQYCSVKENGSLG